MEQKTSVTPKQYMGLLNLYLYKSQEDTISRDDFCRIFHISRTDHRAYSAIYSILENNEIIQKKQTVISYILLINKKLLSKFIRNQEIFLKTESFIHKDVSFLRMSGAITRM